MIDTSRTRSHLRSRLWIWVWFSLIMSKTSIFSRNRKGWNARRLNLCYSPNWTYPPNNPSFADALPEPELAITCLGGRHSEGIPLQAKSWIQRYGMKQLAPSPWNLLTQRVSNNPGSRTIPICQVVLSCWGLWGKEVGRLGQQPRRDHSSCLEFACSIPCQFLLFGGYSALKGLPTMVETWQI